MVIPTWSTKARHFMAGGHCGRGRACALAFIGIATPHWIGIGIGIGINFGFGFGFDFDFDFRFGFGFRFGIGFGIYSHWHWDMRIGVGIFIWRHHAFPTHPREFNDSSRNYSFR